jgi:CBS domain containing-hemolysin-like protein
MPDPDPLKSGETAPPAGRSRDLPVPVATANETRDARDRWFGRVLRALFGWKPGSVRADLQDVLAAASPSETGFSPEESTMLKNILGLRERRIDDVMVPRADIVAIEEDIPLGDLVKVFEKAAHSRLVVFKDTLDEPIGMVHIRDLIAFMTTRAAVDPETNAKRERSLPAGLDLGAIDLAMPLAATKIIRTILFVPPSMPAINLLAKMQATHIHLALVVDEYGGTDGIVSIEDIVELIVGDIEDEHDVDAEHRIVPQSDGSFLADARTSLDDVVAMIGPSFDIGDAAQEVDTIGGYIATRIGRLPVRGELVPGPEPYEIQVLDADPRRVKRVKIYRARPAKSPRDDTKPARAPTPDPTPAAPDDSNKAQPRP